MNNLPDELVNKIVMMSVPTYPYIHQLKFAVKKFESKPNKGWYYHFIEYHCGDEPYDHYPWGHYQWSDTTKDPSCGRGWSDTESDSDCDIEILDN
jgi:hypothetical protein